MDTIDIITFITIIGAILYTVMKYMDKKTEDPTIRFDLTYAMSMIIAIYGAMEIVQVMELNLTIFGVISAFIIGFSFSAGLSAINTKIPIKLEI